MGRAQEIGIHSFPKVWVLSFHQISILRYASSYGKYIGLPINILCHWKRKQNPSYGKSLENWYPYFYQSVGASFPSDSYPMVYSITWKIHGASHQYPIALENTAKCILQGQPGSWFLNFPKVWVVFFHQIPILWYALWHGKCMTFSINFSQHEKMQQSLPHGRELTYRYE